MFASVLIFSSFDLHVTSSPVRYFLLWLSNDIKPTRNAAEPNLLFILNLIGVSALSRSIHFLYPFSDKALAHDRRLHRQWILASSFQPLL